MSRRHGAASMRTRTTLVAAGVVLIALGAGSVGLVWLVRDRLIDADRSATALRANDVSALARSNDLPRRLSFPGDENGATQVLDATGKVIAASRNVEGDAALSALRPTAGATKSEIRTVEAIGDDQRYVVVAVTSSDHKVGHAGDVTVLSARSLESADDTVAALIQALAIGLPLVVITVAATTRFLVGRALRPVAAITAEVSDITDRHLDRRVPEPESSDEIHHLAVTMNRMLERLEASSTRQRRFVADASHELRSPLASARAVLEVAALHPETRSSLVSAINDALVDHDRLDRLALDLLALAKMDDPATSVEVAPVDLALVAADVVERRTEDAVELRTGGSTVTAMTNERMVRRILTNLLDNAVRHRHSASRVTVAVSPVGGTTISVEDDGPGIPEEARRRVFEPFTRLDEARAAGQGTGLGLAIVAEMVAGLGGEVRIEASDLGGAAVVIELSAPANAPLRT